jgi:IclR family pca regulon transcriptional regulator
VTAKKLPGVLREVATQGYALADQELEEGLRALAVPVRSRSGEVIAALNVSAHAMRANKGDMVRNYLPVLRKAAERIGGLG